LKDACDPILKNKDLFIDQQKDIDGNDHDLEAPAVPCGLMAKSFFNDTLELYNQDKDKTQIEFDTTNIAWKTDIEKFKNIKKDLPEGKTWKQVQWTDMEDPRFIVWMRNAGLPNFRKLYGVVSKTITKGQYTLKVKNQYNVKPFEGKKYFLLSNANFLGGKNELLFWCYYVSGAISGVLSLFFIQ